MYSSSLDTPHRTKSPVRYIREPTPPNGFATNRSADKSTRPKYPRATCTPDKYNSPATPTGTGRNRESNTNTDEFHTGAPIDTPTPTNRKRDVTGKRMSVRVNLGGPRIIKKKK